MWSAPLNDVSLQLLAPDVWKWALALVPALCLAFWAYYKILAPLSPPARVTLWILRGLAFALVIFALWQPTLTYRVPDTGKPRLALLVDRSGSMTLPAGEAGYRDRGEEARRRADDLARELSGDYSLEWFDFGDRIEPAVRDSAEVFAGPTSIGGALEEILVRSSADPVHGIVLVSDGVNTQGRDPVRVAKGSPVPVFTVPVGPGSGVPDLEVRRVQTNARAFAGEPLPMDVVLSSSGLEGATGTVRVLSDGEVVEEREVEILGDKGLEQVLHFELHPDEPGWERYDIRVDLDQDGVPENNVREVAVEVMERKTRVLCVSDAIDWDFGFLRQTFDADTTLGYAYLVRTRGDEYRGYGKKPPTALPTNAAALEDYATVVLVSTGSANFPKPFLEAVGSFVARGGGLWIVGGPTDAGSWSQVDRFQRILPAKAVDRAGGQSALAGIELAAQGMRHPITSLRDNPSQTAAVFASLPPIWRSRFGLELKGNGRELLTFRGQGPGRTALVAGFGDRGKVVWLPARGLWRWKLTAVGSEVPASLFADFAIGTVRWLAEPAIRERFQVEPGRRVYPNGESINFLANLWNQSLQPIEDAQIAVEVRADSASSLSVEMAPSTTEPGSYEGRGPGLPPGSYSYVARAVDANGHDLGTAEGTFWVETMGPEFSRIASDRETMRQIASESAGSMVEAASLADLAKSIPDAIRRLGRVKELELWNHWLLFALFVLVLSTEWFLRRRRGLA